MDKLTPDTSFAILQASQGGLSAATNKLRSLDKMDDAAKDARQMAKIEEAAQDFEAVFMAEMIKPMFEGIETNKEFGGGKGEEIFSGFMIQEYGKILAQTGDIGIADQVKAEMIKRQGLATAESTKDENLAQQGATDTTDNNAFNTIINDLTTDGDL